MYQRFGGIHVSAVRKDPCTYEHIDPKKVGNQRKFSISELSGRSNILEKARQMGLEIKPDSASVQNVLARVKDLERQGYHFEGAEASFELLFKGLLGQVKKYFTLDGFRVMVWKNSDNNAWAEATIKAEVPQTVCRERSLTDSVEHTSADGSGPVEALDKALRKVLEKFYPSLDQVRLIDYKVRILNEKSGTRSVTRVLITSHDQRRRWGTVGVSDNIIDASWQALVDSLIYKLMKDDEEKELPNGKKT
jgi:2-isopropylmalate synthase